MISPGSINQTPSVSRPCTGAALLGQQHVSFCLEIPNTIFRKPFHFIYFPFLAQTVSADGKPARSCVLLAYYLRFKVSLPIKCKAEESRAFMHSSCVPPPPPSIRSKFISMPCRFQSAFPDPLTSPVTACASSLPFKLGVSQGGALLWAWEDMMGLK